MKLRHSNHKQEIKKVVGGLGHHYGGPEGCGYENLRLTIIEQAKEKNPEFLAERELYWQHQLRVYIENVYRNHCRKKEFRKCKLSSALACFEKVSMLQFISFWYAKLC